ncbi:hypothetical protein L3X38_002750 [Prunus dulcis]|uniref:Uncharacterized protein n=1 Tax=Prunus dulcis TaxID=3755 RepID=A0AAD4WUJ7_PRUDU|nr:hypothetical protein L3X38_002750 [Prunus dulcis]
MESAPHHRRMLFQATKRGFADTMDGFSEVQGDLRGRRASPILLPLVGPNVEDTAGCSLEADLGLPATVTDTAQTVDKASEAKLNHRRDLQEVQLARTSCEWTFLL